ncbi:MAG: aminoacyl-tRNA hydrolase [Acidimicrobiia bacterium]|nr:aminoacyl-tRNA hydrolase [Acidimicrobiia bacterium]MCY4458542.1 alternative ribosome rescue aminoacyl-tRNA hydrolase ArfB [Acidimicrobiaceae bacterium]
MSQHEVNDRLLLFPGGAVPAAEVAWRFDPSGGPGGQHANRSSTRVEAVIDLTTAGDVEVEARKRLIAAFGAALRVVVDDTRSQARNREIALDRLESRLRDALTVPKPRRPTRPSRSAKARRLQAKRRRSETKRGRGRIDPTERTQLLLGSAE